MTYRSYESETDRLAKQYRKAVGEAIALGIKVYYPGSGRPGYRQDDGTYVAADLGPWGKSLGDLQDEIRAAQGQTNEDFSHCLATAFERAENR